MVFAYDSHPQHGFPLNWRNLIGPFLITFLNFILCYPGFSSPQLLYNGQPSQYDFRLEWDSNFLLLTQFCTVALTYYYCFIHSIDALIFPFSFLHLFSFFQLGLKTHFCPSCQNSSLLLTHNPQNSTSTNYKMGTSYFT